METKIIAAVLIITIVFPAFGFCGTFKDYLGYKRFNNKIQELKEELFKKIDSIKKDVSLLYEDNRKAGFVFFQSTHGPVLLNVTEITCIKVLPKNGFNLDDNRYYIVIATKKDTLTGGTIYSKEAAEKELLNLAQALGIAPKPQ